MTKRDCPLPTTYLPYNSAFVGKRLGGAVTKVHPVAIPPDGSRAQVRRMLYRQDVEGVYTFFLLGLGTADYAVELLANWNRDVLVVCIDWNPGAIRTTFERRNLTPWLHTNRLAVLLNPSRAELFKLLSPVAYRFFLSTGTSVGQGVRIIKTPAAVSNPKFYREQLLNIMDFYDYMGAGFRSSIILAMNTKKNLLMNLREYVHQAGLQSLKGLLHNQPVVIVSAGPSLDKNMHLLHDYKGCIVAVGTIYKKLRQAGITPHFVVSLDYHPISGKYLSDAPTSSTVLVADPKMSYGALAQWAGEKVLLGNWFLNEILKPLGLNRPSLPAGGCVAHLAYYLAQWLGADPIIFVGQDLSYETLEKNHADGADAYYPTNTEEGVPIPRMAVIDMYGNRIWTDALMHAYAVHFERDFVDSKARIINATEGGILTSGCEVMPLKEALDATAGVSANLQIPRTLPPDNNLTDANIDTALDAFLEECEETLKLYAGAEPVIEQRIEALKSGDANVFKALEASHAEYQKRVNNTHRMAVLFSEISSRGEFRKLRDDMRIEGGGLRDDARRIAQHTRDLNYVRELQKGGKVLIRLVKEIER